jgi:hypothetical protein
MKTRSSVLNSNSRRFSDEKVDKILKEKLNDEAMRDIHYAIEAMRRSKLHSASTYQKMAAHRTYIKIEKI